MVEEVKIPEISENVSSGKIVSVLVAVGDAVEVDDVLVELETEKAVVEIPSTCKGKIKELFAEEGKEMQVGDVIARIETEAESEEKEKAGEEPKKAPPEDDKQVEREENGREVAAAEAESGSGRKPAEDKAVARRAEGEKEAGRDDRAEKDRAEAEPVDAERPPKEGVEDKSPGGSGPVPASPSVRRFARELGVDIHAVRATGIGGRITEEDIKAHAKRTGRSEERTAEAVASPVPAETTELPDFGRWGDVETRELETVRRLTAESTFISWRTVPHVTQFDRADITELQAFIEKNAAKAARRNGKLTITPVLIKICAEALKKYPRFNASIDPVKRQLILKKYIHIGLMVATPRGLLVPVIRNADRMSIMDLAAAVVDIAERSRNKKIHPEEMEGGTFSISNQGGLGGTAFTPIVLWPQAAVLGISRAAVEPKFIDGELRPRRMLPLSLSYDHRIVDGADAARFLRWVCECLEYPFTLLLD
jgi:pyruvate dehydrogenase E2 component (dihydrolipoamide acetyltransferase)